MQSAVHTEYSDGRMLCFQVVDHNGLTSRDCRLCIDCLSIIGLATKLDATDLSSQ